MKLLFICVGILAILSLLFIVYSNVDMEKINNELNPQELTTNQTLSLIELNAINIHTDIEYTEGDKMINIVARTINGDCYIYQDIFGRYYCRWKQ